MVKIRKAQRGDMRQIAVLFRQEFNKKPYKERWTAKTAAKRIRLYSKNSAMFVALEDSKVAGFVIVSDFYFHDGWNGFVDEIVVGEACQSRGVGTALLRRVEKHFIKRGFKAVRLVSYKNSRVHGFYKKRGYKETPLVVMRKTLR